jgi:hypothetical protein
MSEEAKKLSGEREAAKAASQGCRECCGSGVTSRYDEINTGQAVEYVSVGCICHLCQMGDFVREAREATGEQSLRRLVDLRKRPDLAHEILKFSPDAQAALSDSRGWCEPRSMPGGIVAAWNARKARTAARGSSVPAGRTNTRTAVYHDPAHADATTGTPGA